MRRLRWWLALFTMKCAVRLCLLSARMEPGPINPQGPSDYPDPAPGDLRDDFWERRRIIRHPGGVVSVASSDKGYSDDGEEP